MYLCTYRYHLIPPFPPTIPNLHLTFTLTSTSLYPPLPLLVLHGPLTSRHGLSPLNTLMPCQEILSHKRRLTLGALERVQQNADFLGILFVMGAVVFLEFFGVAFVGASTVAVVDGGFAGFLLRGFSAAGSGAGRGRGGCGW